MTQVIEDQDAVEEHQYAVRDVKIIFGVRADLLQLAHNVVRTVSDRSCCKWRQAFHDSGTVRAKQFLDRFENVAGASFDFATTLDFDLRAARFEAQKRTHAEKGVASNLFSAFDRFQQKSVGLVL